MRKTQTVAPVVDDGPAEPMTLALLVRPDGSACVPLSAVAGALGAGEDFVHNRARAHKVAAVLATTDYDPDGVAAFELADAVGLIRTLRAEQDEHRSQWDSYVAYRDATKREAAEKRAAEMAAARETERQRQLNLNKDLAEKQAKQALEEAAQKAAAKAAREGAPAEFEAWVRS